MGDADEFVVANRFAIEEMLRGEVHARRRRAAKAAKIAAGYVPRAQPRRVDPKPICRKCEVINNVVVKSNCCNPRCTFTHGKFDKREYIRSSY